MDGLRPGDRIGGYEVCGPGAAGRSASVYPVVDLRTGESRAMKHMLAHADARIFDHEYEVMSRLNHASVLRTYRYGVHEERPWFTMETLSGEPSHVRVKALGKPGTEARRNECLAIAGMAARALVHVHGRGVVHCDVKPANLVLLPDRRLRLIDFADALLPGQASVEGVGTHGFSAPEALTGGQADARSDLYSLGATLYRLLSGKSPFKAPIPDQVLARQQARDCTPIQQLDPGLSRTIADLIEAMLDPDPEQRPDSAGSVAERLQLVTGNTILSGSSLAIYHEAAADPTATAAAIVADLTGFSVIYSDDHRHVRGIVDAIGVETRSRREPQLLAALHGDGRAELSEAIHQISAGKIPLKHAQRLPLEKLAGYLAQLSRKRPLTVIFETSPEDIEAQRGLLTDFAAACRTAGANVRTIVLDEQQGPDLDGATHYRFGRLDVAETAIAVGRMIGRKPPTGEIAHQLYDTSGGYRSAVSDVVHALVASDQVRTEGNQVYWARTELRLTESKTLVEELDGRLQLCSKQQLLVLQAVARAGAMSSDALCRVLPNPDAVRGSIAHLLSAGLLIERGGRLRPSSPPLRRAILEARGGFPPAVLERMLLAAANELPDSPFKVKGLIQKRDVHLAIASANREADRLIAKGRWLAARDVVQPLWDAVGTKTGGSDGLSRAYVHLASAAVVTAHGVDLATEAAEAALQMAGSADQSIRCQLVLADIQRSKGHYRNFQKHLGLAWDLARDKSKNVALQARTALAVAHSALLSGEVRRAGRLLEEIDTSDEAVSTATHVRVLAALARCDVAEGRLADGIGTAQHALDIGTEEPAALSDAVHSLGNALRRAGRHTEALEILADGAQATRFHVDPRPYLQIVLTTGWCEVDLHRLGPAQECVDELQAALNPTELLHSRIESQLLEARVRLLSGDRAEAWQILDNAHESARVAGLAHLANRAHSSIFLATEKTRLNQGELSRWFDSQRIGFMASRDLWAFARAFQVLSQCALPVPDPDTAFSALEKAIENETPPHLAAELHLARARFAESRNDRTAELLHLRDAATALSAMAETLADAERGAMRVHPWALRIRHALARR